MKTTTGTSRQPLVLADALEHLEAGHVRQAKIEHHAVARLLGERRQRRGAAVGRHDVEVVVTEQLLDAQLLRRVVLDDEQPLPPRRGVRLETRDRRIQPFLRRRLGDERECAARQPVLPILVEAHDLHGDVARLGILFELTEHRPSEHVRQEEIERHRSRTELARQRQRVDAARGDQRLQPLVVRQVDQDARVVRVVLDDQERRIARLHVVAIVQHDFDRTLGLTDDREPRASMRAGPRSLVHGACRQRRTRRSASAGTA